MQGDDHRSPICSSGLLTVTIWFVLQIIQHHDISRAQGNLKKKKKNFLREEDRLS